MANKSMFKAIGKGDLRVLVPNGEHCATITLRDTLYCPTIRLTLISISRITSAGCIILFRGDACQIFNSKLELIGQIERQGGLYKVDHSNQELLGGVAEETLMMEEMHRRMGHVAPDVIRQMIKDKAFVGPRIEDNEDLKTCESCEYGKMTRKPIAKVHQ